MKNCYFDSENKRVQFNGKAHASRAKDLGSIPKKTPV